MYCPVTNNDCVPACVFSNDGEVCDVAGALKGLAGLAQLGNIAEALYSISGELDRFNNAFACKEMDAYFQAIGDIGPCIADAIREMGQ